MPLSNTIKAKGLYTFGNELAHPDASQVIADDVNIDESGVITPRRGFADIGDMIPSDAVRMKQLLTYKKTPIRHYETTLSFERNGQFTDFYGNYDQVTSDTRIKYQEANSNLYFTSDSGIKKISARNSGEFNSDVGYIRDAGVPKALDISGNVVYDTTGFLPPQAKVAYKVLFGYKDVNGNLLRGSPSVRTVITNSSSDVYTYEKSLLEFKQPEQFRSQRTTVTCGTRVDTNETDVGHQDSQLRLHSKNDEYKYLLWFNQGNAPLVPFVSGYSNIEIDLTSLSPGDNVAPKIVEACENYGIQGINVFLNGTQVIFENIDDGTSTGVTIPSADPTDIGPAWGITVNRLGTNSRYIQKYFILNDKNASYCVYWGNSQTINQVPSDPSVASKIFVPVLIENESNASFIVNRTAQALMTLPNYEIELNTSGINPTITVTDIVGGNIQDAEQGTVSSSTMEVIIITQGNITEGQRANVEVEFIIPEGVDNTFFYQLYRSAYITVTDGLSLNDIDPGEECFLVHEEPVSGASGSKITLTDITPETFRQQGEPLYNNPQSGQGILQNNDQPPIAVDIHNYKNYTFYANTRTFHRYNSSFISLDSFNTGVSALYIGNSDVVRKYTFVGEPHETTIFTGLRSMTLVTKSNNYSRIELYSARDQQKYVIWFDDGTGDEPTDDNSIKVRIDLTLIQPSDQVAPLIYEAFSQFSDFKLTTNGIAVQFINAENGLSSDAKTPFIPWDDIGTGWNVVNASSGKGEDPTLNHVLLTGSASVAISLDMTARSLVRVINQDVLSPVSAFYMSGPNDLPGKIMLENRRIESGEFYVARENISDDSSFSPEIPQTNAGILAVTPDDNDTILTYFTPHSFIDGEEVYFSLPSNIPAIHGKYQVEIVNTTEIKIKAVTITPSLSNARWFFPYEVSDNQETPNRLYYSKVSQPEAVPLVNYIDVGTKDEPIKRILALRDNLFVLKTDGIYMISGFGPPFTQRFLDTESIACPDSAVVLNNQIYMASNNSVISVNESSPSIISRMIEDQISILFDEGYNSDTLGFGVGYEDDRAYLLWLPTSKEDRTSTQCFRYNIIERTWTRWTKTASCGVISRENPKLFIGDGDRAIVMEERKNRDRTDYADKDFMLNVPIDSFYKDRYRLSAVEEVVRGDVMVQSQTVSVNEYNRLLLQLDSDEGLDDTDYYETLECVTGDNIAALLNLLNTKIMNDDSSGTVTPKVFFNTNWIEMQELFNLMVEELNTNTCDTELKNYRKSSGVVNFEYIVTEVYPTTNEVKFYKDTVLIQGDIRVYKSIKSVIQYNPIHFGNPSSWKQVNTGYLMVDQNNFYEMLLEYSTDLKPSFVGHMFYGKGTGYWDYGDWSENEKSYWGGDGNDAPRRVIIPRDKQRCRYINVRITHAIAREGFRIVGVAHNVREYSNRAYK